MLHQKREAGNAIKIIPVQYDVALSDNDSGHLKASRCWSISRVYVLHGPFRFSFCSRRLTTSSSRKSWAFRMICLSSTKDIDFFTHFFNTLAKLEP